MTAITAMLLILAGAILFYFLVYQPPAQKYWLRFPTADEYRLRHPEACVGCEPRCWKCGSKHIVSAGLLRPVEYRRLHQCANCHEKLWRAMEP